MLSPIPPDDNCLPDGIDRRATWREFVEAVNEHLPNVTIREDHAFLIAAAQSAADLGDDIPEALARFALACPAPVRYALRDLAQATVLAAAHTDRLREAALARGSKR